MSRLSAKISERVQGEGWRNPLAIRKAALADER
jgi:hypothetical protein